MPFALPKLYEKYQEIIESDHPEELYLYVKRKWYTSRKYAAWWGSHLDLDNYTYFGYWNFEAAAIAKIMKLDDTQMLKCPYYPYDLAHYHKS